MTYKMENLIKILIGVAGIALATACEKDTIVHESINEPTEIRSNVKLADFYRTSWTIYDYNQDVQIIINSDSLHSASFVRANTARAGKTHPVTGQQYSAGVFRIIFHFKNKSDLSGVYYVKDTTANIFTLVPSPNGLSSDLSFISYKRLSEYENYFDHRTQKGKRRYLYSIDGRPPEYLQSWHHPNSSVFFLDHKN